MSRGINKVVIVGSLGQDPEVRYTQKQKAVTTLSVATSESWKDQQGQKQEATEWHRIVLFGKLAEIAGQYLTKGSQVYLEGKLKTRKWQDQQGQDRYTTEIIVDGFDGKMQILGGSQQNQATRQQAPHRQKPEQQKQQSPMQQAPMQEPDFNFDDDIPF